MVRATEGASEPQEYYNLRARRTGGWLSFDQGRVCVSGALNPSYREWFVLETDKGLVVRLRPPDRESRGKNLYLTGDARGQVFLSETLEKGSYWAKFTYKGVEEPCEIRVAGRDAGPRFLTVDDTPSRVHNAASGLSYDVYYVKLTDREGSIFRSNGPHAIVKPGPCTADFYTVGLGKKGLLLTFDGRPFLFPGTSTDDLWRVGHEDGNFTIARRGGAKKCLLLAGSRDGRVYLAEKPGEETLWSMPGFKGVGAEKSPIRVAGREKGLRFLTADDRPTMFTDTKGLTNLVYGLKLTDKEGPDFSLCVIAP